MKKKCILSVVICSVLFIFIALHLYLKSEIYLEQKIDCVKEEIHQYLVDNLPEFQVIADEMVEIYTEQNIIPWCNGEQGNLSENLHLKWRSFCKNCPIGFDGVEINDSMLYPIGSCVFYHTIWQGEDIYAWVTVVYCPNLGMEDPAWFRRPGSIEINKNWYIVVAYGY